MSRLSSLTPSRSVTPTPGVAQPDHFYGSQNTQVPLSPTSDRKTWLSPDDDPLAHRGIPVFKPTMAEFQDFEGYMTKIECWGMRSGIVKVIPPKEWTDSLPSVIPQLRDVKIKSPIEQHMLGTGGLFRQENLEKRKYMSVREWVELCRKDDFRAPGVDDMGSRSAHAKPLARGRRAKKKNNNNENGTKAETPGPAAAKGKRETGDGDQSKGTVSQGASATITPPNSIVDDGSPMEQTEGDIAPAEEKSKTRTRRTQTKEMKEANHARDMEFFDHFDPHNDWLPANTKPSDYTFEFCQKLERHYWRNLGIGRPAWYGADTQGSLFTDETKSWNVAHLPSTLSRLLPASNQGLPGVNTPYLYFGMWRATFSWHVEDMDLFSINYIHFGAPKYWYAIPQGRANALEQTMRGYFPKDTSQCSQFLRHKSFLASPTILAQSSCRPNFLVQHAGEFVITFPRGYHAGLNLGLNCAESVNFALDSWIEIGRRAKACQCITDSVRIDVDQLLQDRGLEIAPNGLPTLKKPKPIKMKVEEFDSVLISLPPSRATSRKRKSENEEPTQLKKIKIKASQTKGSASQASVGTSHVPSKPVSTKISLTLKLPPRPVETEVFPCCLCVSQDSGGLLKVYEPPLGRKDIIEAAGNPKIWMAHEECAKVVPETWVDEVDGPNGAKEKMVFGVDAIVKDRWNLKCSACTKTKSKLHGAPVQCTKGKCPKAFHVSCARSGLSLGLVFEIVREVEKEVVLMDSNPAPMQVDLPAETPAETPAESQQPNDRVLKVIKKLEVNLLCTQHNPTIAAEKRANKQERIKKELLALPSMSRIKIRVSAGVFEVSLVRVIEETGSIEVLWDRGLKKEFKWGSVVFGNTDGPVLQKPSEPAPEPQVPQTIPPGSTLSIPLKPSNQPNIPAPSSSVQSAASQPSTSFSVPYYAPRPAYNYWPYGSAAAQTPYASVTQYPYPYSSYYAGIPLNGNYGPSYAYSQPQYRGGQLHWQQPYQGPRPSSSMQQSQNGNAVTSDRTFSAEASNSSQNQEPDASAVPPPAQQHQLPAASDNGHAPQPPEKDRSPLPTAAQPSASSSQPLLTNTTLQSDTSASLTFTPEVERAILNNLVALSAMQPAQLAQILQSHSQLQAVLSAMNQTKPSSS